MTKIAVSVIETSADMHTAMLIRAIKKTESDIEFIGFGSEQMQKEGVKLIQDLSHRSTIGILEPFRHLFHYLIALSRFKKMLKKEKPDAVLCVDGEGFNIPVCKAAKKLNIPVMYYISPQAWLWGTVEQGKKVAKHIDLVIAIFPEEAKFYSDLGVNVIYNGHPLSEIVNPEKTREQFLKEYDIQGIPIAFFPGSRTQELEQLLPLFLKTAASLDPKYEPIFVSANRRSTKLLADKPFKVISAEDRYNVMAHSQLIICTTGTTTLEAAFCGTPMISGYRFPEISYRVIVALYNKRLPRYMALPNLLADRLIVPELIQKDLSVDRILQEIDKIDLDLAKTDLEKLRSKMRRDDVLKNNSLQIQEFLDNLNLK